MLHSELDEPLDGIIYGVAVALGFASVENAVYLAASDDVLLVVMRSFTATLAHVVFGGSLGFFLGLARFARPLRRLWLLPMGFVVSVTLHGLYDLFLSRSPGVARVALVVILPLGLALVGWMLRVLRARSHLFHPTPTD